LALRLLAAVHFRLLDLGLLTRYEPSVYLAEHFVIEGVLLKNLSQVFLLLNSVHCRLLHLCRRTHFAECSSVFRVVMVFNLDRLCAVETVGMLTLPVRKLHRVEFIDVVSHISMEGLVIVVLIVIIKSLHTLDSYALLPAEMLPLEGQRS